MIALLKRKAEADNLAVFDLLIEDETFWQEFESTMARAIVPAFYELFLAGAVAGSKVKPRNLAQKQAVEELAEFLSPEDYSRIAEDAIRAYTPQFLKGVTDTTIDGLKDAVVRARRDGTGVQGVMASIQPLFGPERAEAIAITETSRLFGRGSQAIYRAQGINGWEWMTAEDPRVEEICTTLNGETFLANVDFDPAHPRCRCWPSPVILDVPVAPAVFEPVEQDPLAFKRWAENQDTLVGRSELTKDQAEWIGWYQGGGHGQMNSLLRYGEDLGLKLDSSILKELESGLDSVMARSATNADVLVYRGTRETLSKLNPRVGEVFHDRGFVSTTLDRTLAEKNFSKGFDEGFIWEIEVPTGSPAAYVNKALGHESLYHIESELILDRGAQLRVLAIDKDAGIIRARYLGSDHSLPDME